MAIRIIIDPLPAANRVAVLRDGRLISFFEDHGQGGSGAALTLAAVVGSVVMVRVDQVFASRQMVSCDLGGVTGSLRWAGGSMPEPGQRLIATIAAEPREDKPLQLRRGVVIEDPYMIVETGISGLKLSRRLEATGFTAPANLASQCKDARLTLRRHAAGLDETALTGRAETLMGEAVSLMGQTDAPLGVIRPGPDAIETALQAFPDAEVITDDDGSVWQEAEIDALLEAALSPQQKIKGGGILQISTPPGASVIDGDSGTSGLSPETLADAMVTPVAEALMLRRISGPVVIDFPRLGKSGMKRIDQAMKDAVASDPLHPQCHGFTAGGLYTLTRPWRWQPLSRLLAETPERQGVAAVRLGRRMASKPRAGVVLTPPEAHDWIIGQGAGWTEDVMKGVARLIEFRSDNACDHPQFIGH